MALGGKGQVVPPLLDSEQERPGQDQALEAVGGLPEDPQKVPEENAPLAVEPVKEELGPGDQAVHPGPQAVPPEGQDVLAAGAGARADGALLPGHAVGAVGKPAAQESEAGGCWLLWCGAPGRLAGGLEVLTLLLAQDEHGPSPAARGLAAAVTPSPSCGPDHRASGATLLLRVWAQPGVTRAWQVVRGRVCLGAAEDRPACRWGGRLPLAPGPRPGRRLRRSFPPGCPSGPGQAGLGGHGEGSGRPPPPPCVFCEAPESWPCAQVGRPPSLRRSRPRGQRLESRGMWRDRPGTPRAASWRVRPLLSPGAHPEPPAPPPRAMAGRRRLARARPLHSPAACWGGTLNSTRPTSSPFSSRVTSSGIRFLFSLLLLKNKPTAGVG